MECMTLLELSIVLFAPVCEDLSEGRIWPANRLIGNRKMPRRLMPSMRVEAILPMSLAGPILAARRVLPDRAVDGFMSFLPGRYTTRSLQTDRRVYRPDRIGYRVGQTEHEKNHKHIGCLRRSTATGGERRPSTIYSLAIGCHSKKGDSELPQGPLLFKLPEFNYGDDSSTF